jgi:Holliday junction resolvase
VGIMQRRKGANSERELFGLLRDELGIAVERNLSQTRGGGADSLSIDGLAIEVKRQEKPFSDAWWRQAVKQAGSTRTPIVAYRQSRQPWRFVVPLGWLMGQDIFHFNMRATVDFKEFCYLVRERICLEQA